MKNLFEQEGVQEIISRLDRLQPAAVRQWGKMDVAQMMAHCSAGMDMASGRLNPPRAFIGLLLGRLVRPVFTNEKPFVKNNPTDKRLMVADARDFARERENLKAKIRQFHEGGDGGFRIGEDFPEEGDQVPLLCQLGKRFEVRCVHGLFLFHPAHHKKRP